MKKIIPILVVGFLVLGGLGAVSGTESDEENIISEKILFSQPTLEIKENYVYLDSSDATVYSNEKDKPTLPVVNKVYTFPFGTKIDNVAVTFSDFTEKEISKPIEPSPEIHTLSSISLKNKETQEILTYSDINAYPEERFGYRAAAGLKGEENVIYVVVSLYPDQYFPQRNIISHAGKAEIEIEYTLPVTPITFPDEYDLLIIAPEAFQSALQPLVDHKNNLNPPVNTILVNLEDIPSGVGVDQQEDIKYYIRDAKENWGITYLLLVGAGLKDNEIFPVRYAWIDSAPIEDNFPSDLYYADFYNSTGGFSNWDKDGDGKYAEWNIDFANVDVLPDVYLGKMPANNAAEVTTVVNKIINYKASNKMVKKILQVAGDGVAGDAVNEGEYANVKVLEKLPGYSSIRVWASHPNPDYETQELTKMNIRKGFMSAVDFVDFSGHGSYASWAVHPPNDDTVWLPEATLISPRHGFLFYDYDQYMIRNSKKLPVVVYTACCNHKYVAFEECLGWKGLIKENGGAIAGFAESGIGHGSSGAAFVTRMIGWMEIKIFEELYNAKILGDAWGNAITSYYTNFETNLLKTDYKTMIEFSMFGDPTLAIEDGDNPKTIPRNVPINGLLERLLESFPRLVELLKPIIEKLLGFY